MSYFSDIIEELKAHFKSHSSFRNIYDNIKSIQEKTYSIAWTTSVQSSKTTLNDKTSLLDLHKASLHDLTSKVLADIQDWNTSKPLLPHHNSYSIKKFKEIVSLLHNSLSENMSDEDFRYLCKKFTDKTAIVRYHGLKEPRDHCQFIGSYKFEKALPNQEKPSLLYIAFLFIPLVFYVNLSIFIKLLNKYPTYPGGESFLKTCPAYQSLDSTFRYKQISDFSDLPEEISHKIDTMMKYYGISDNISKHQKLTRLILSIIKSNNSDKHFMPLLHILSNNALIDEITHSKTSPKIYVRSVAVSVPFNPPNHQNPGPYPQALGILRGVAIAQNLTINLNRDAIDKADQQAKYRYLLKVIIFDDNPQSGQFNAQREFGQRLWYMINSHHSIDAKIVGLIGHLNPLYNPIQNCYSKLLPVFAIDHFSDDSKNGASFSLLPSIAKYREKAYTLIKTLVGENTKYVVFYDPKEPSSQRLYDALCPSNSFLNPAPEQCQPVKLNLDNPSVLNSPDDSALPWLIALNPFASDNIYLNRSVEATRNIFQGFFDSKIKTGHRKLLLSHYFVDETTVNKLKHTYERNCRSNEICKTNSIWRLSRSDWRASKVDDSVNNGQYSIDKDGFKNAAKYYDTTTLNWYAFRSFNSFVLLHALLNFNVKEDADIRVNRQTIIHELQLLNKRREEDLAGLNYILPSPETLINTDGYIMLEKDDKLCLTNLFNSLDSKKDKKAYCI